MKKENNGFSYLIISQAQAGAVFGSGYVTVEIRPRELMIKELLLREGEKIAVRELYGSYYVITTPDVLGYKGPHDKIVWGHIRIVTENNEYWIRDIRKIPEILKSAIIAELVVDVPRVEAEKRLTLAERVRQVVDRQRGLTRDSRENPLEDKKPEKFWVRVACKKCGVEYLTHRTPEEYICFNCSKNSDYRVPPGGPGKFPKVKKEPKNIIHFKPSSRGRRANKGSLARLVKQKMKK